MIGLARGVGQEIAQINEYETSLINEHDAAVFIFGNFKECIKRKRACISQHQCAGRVTGGPEISRAEIPYAFEYFHPSSRGAQGQEGY
jgi:methyl coenzyme M reductase subunit C-like uncharacterized protein (methanogenesis marker protein 7)